MFREWPLRGVAICPYGADNQTSVNALSDEKFSVLFVNKEKEMSTENMSAEEKKAQELKLEEEKKAAELKEKKAAELKKEETESTVMLSSDGTSGPAFIKAYGPDGGVWFAEGKSFQEAGTLYIAKLEGRVEGLEKKLTAVVEGLGDDDAIKFDDDGAESDPNADHEKKVAGLAMKIGHRLARFAAGIKIPK